MHWYRKRDKEVYIFINRQKALPRAETKFLDSHDDAYINAYVAKLEREAGTYKAAPLSDPALTKLVDSYLKYLTTRRKSSATIDEHRRSLLEFAIPFFLEEGLTDLNTWPSKSIKLLPYLETKGGPSLAVKVNGAINSFWRWLLDEGEVVTGINIRLRYPVKDKKETPLQFSLMPEDVLAWARNPTHPADLCLMALLGYFFSLRPQELFALRPADFRGGKELELECSRVMKRANLDGRLVVHVTRQRTKQNKFQKPKVGSTGWVACFSKDAAAEIVKRLKGRAPDELLFKDPNDANFRKWGKAGYPEVTLKDLRRASIYYLGHHTSIEISGLRSHARHASLATTALYLRRSEEEMTWKELDLDA